jgi:hypothetical protein
MPTRLSLRLAPELHRAIRAKAEAAGVSINSWIVHVLAAAAGEQFFRTPDDGGTPRTIAESRRDAYQRERIVRFARAAYVSHHVVRGMPHAEAIAVSDDDAVAWYERRVRNEPPAAARAG